MTKTTTTETKNLTVRRESLRELTTADPEEVAGGTNHHRPYRRPSAQTEEDCA